MTRTDAIVVRRHVVVNAPQAKAFAAFTGRFGDFKPPEHNLLAAPIAETVFEPRAGGHIYDRAADGSECRWARILAYEPPDRVTGSPAASRPTGIGPSARRLTMACRVPSASAFQPSTARLGFTNR